MFSLFFCVPSWRSAGPNASNKYKCRCLRIIFNKCHVKVNKTKPRVTDNEPNKINWEPIKTNIGCSELYLLAKKERRKRRSFIYSSPSFGGGCSLCGIIYCFPAVITYSSCYLVELWRHIKTPDAGGERERETKEGRDFSLFIYDIS